MDLIDRKLRQRFLPFKGDGNTPQKWSFSSSVNNTQIYINPDDHDGSKEDISFKQVFNFLNNKIDDKEKLNLNGLISTLPKLSIREYTQDTRLDMILSLVDYFKQGYKDGGDFADKVKDSPTFKAASELVAYDIRNINKNKFIHQMIDGVWKLFNLKDDIYIESADRKLLIDFCYTMYYRLLTTTTTNIYTIPYSSSHILKGNGSIGWDNAYDFFGNMDQYSGIGESLVKFIAPNITLTTTPIWKGMKGGEGVNIDITLNLFNDTAEKALNNFIFVHTILPQNLPTQYGCINQPPSLYDLRIEGGNRLFMCTGDFECQYKGVLRTPSNSFRKSLEKQINTVVVEDKKLLEQDIRIPDIYEITMHFKSLLPNNFNNFLFQFALNGKMDTVSGIQKGMMEDDGENPVSSALKDWLDQIAKDAEKLKDLDEKVLLAQAKNKKIEEDESNSETESGIHVNYESNKKLIKTYQTEREKIKQNRDIKP